MNHRLRTPGNQINQKGALDSTSNQPFVCMYVPYIQKVYFYSAVLCPTCTAPNRSIFGGPATTLHPSFLYIQLELCTEGTLRDWLLTGEGGEQRGVDIFDQVRFAPHPSSVLFILFFFFTKVLEVVAFIHEKGFVHRNLKPSNIYLFKNSKIKVGDFGFVTNGRCVAAMCQSYLLICLHFHRIEIQIS